MIVNQDQVRKVREKLARGSEKDVVSDLRQMLEIKQALLSRADMGLCCAQGCWLSDFLSREVMLLEETLQAAEKGDKGKADSLLTSYLDLLSTNYYEENGSVYCRL